MLQPYVVEEYDGKFWVHKRRSYNHETRKYDVLGELAYKRSFRSKDKAQIKADKLSNKDGKLW